MLVAFTGALSAGEREVVKPLIADKLISARLTQQEMTGGEIDRRIMDLIYKNFMVLNLDPKQAKAINLFLVGLPNDDGIA
jgi:hypothetical protein